MKNVMKSIMKSIMESKNAIDKNNVVHVYVDTPITTIQYEKTKITLVGIVHNSEQSLQYVEEVLTNTDSNVPVLLEYCIIRLEANELSRLRSIWHLLAKAKLTIEPYVINYCTKTNRMLYFIDKSYKWSMKQLYKNRKLHLIKDVIVKAIATLIGIECTVADEETIRKSEDSKVYEFDLETYKWLVEERDRYMARVIKRFIRTFEPNEVVVIVGRAHLPGIIQNLQS